MNVRHLATAAFAFVSLLCAEAAAQPLRFVVEEQQCTVRSRGGASGVSVRCGTSAWDCRDEANGDLSEGPGNEHVLLCSDSYPTAMVVTSADFAPIAVRVIETESVSATVIDAVPGERPFVRTEETGGGSLQGWTYIAVYSITAGEIREVFRNASLEYTADYESGERIEASTETPIRIGQPAPGVITVGPERVEGARVRRPQTVDLHRWDSTSRRFVGPVTCPASGLESLDGLRRLRSLVTARSTDAAVLRPATAVLKLARLRPPTLSAQDRAAGLEVQWGIRVVDDWYAHPDASCPYLILTWSAGVGRAGISYEERSSAVVIVEAAARTGALTAAPAAASDPRPSTQARAQAQGMADLVRADLGVPASGAPPAALRGSMGRTEWACGCEAATSMSQRWHPTPDQVEAALRASAEGIARYCSGNGDEDRFDPVALEAVARDCVGSLRAPLGRVTVCRGPTDRGTHCEILISALEHRGRQWVELGYTSSADAVADLFEIRAGAISILARGFTSYLSQLCDTGTPSDGERREFPDLVRAWRTLPAEARSFFGCPGP